MLLNASSVYTEMDHVIFIPFKIVGIILVDLQILNHPGLPGSISYHPRVWSSHSCALSFCSSSLCPGEQQEGSEWGARLRSACVHWGSGICQSGLQGQLQQAWSALLRDCEHVNTPWWAVDAFSPLSISPSRELVFKRVKERALPVLDLRCGVPSVWFQSSFPREDWDCVISLFHKPAS